MKYYYRLFMPYYDIFTQLILLNKDLYSEKASKL